MTQEREDVGLWIFFTLLKRRKVQLVGAQASVTDRGGQMSYDVDTRWACVTERCPTLYVQHHRSQHHFQHHHRQRHHDDDNNLAL